MKRHPETLDACSRCDELYPESELLHTDAPEDASGRGGKIIDPTCEECVRASREPDLGEGE